MAKYLDPKNDVVFKKIFGQHPHLLISFLNSQLKFEDGSIIESIEYLKDELIPDNPLKKRSVVDVRCRDNNGRQFIVEMQMEWIADFLQRMLYNTAKIYSSQIKKGDNYLKLQPVYGLAILNENFDKKSPEYYHHFEMINKKNPQEGITGMNVVLIELPKFVPQSKDDKRATVLWLRFLKEIDEETRQLPEEFKENKDICEAAEVCEEVAFSDSERIEYEEYWDAISTEKMKIGASFRDGKAEGKTEGRAEGKAEGIKIGEEKGKAEGIKIGEAKGRAEGKAEIAKTMLLKNIPIEDIAEITGLSIEEIEKLQ